MSDLATKAVFMVWGPPSHGNRTRVFARGLGIEVHHVYSTTRRGPWAAPVKYPYQAVATLVFLARTRPDIVFVQNPPSFAPVVVAFYAWLARKKFVVDSHTDAFVSPWWTRPAWLYRLVARRAVATVVTNQHLADRIRSWGGDALVIRDIPGEQPTGTYPMPEGFNVAVVATFADDEPLDEIVETARRMPDVRFWVTGDPGREGAAVPTDIPPNVTLTGFLSLSEYFGLLRDCDVVMCLTTRDHTMQRGACEALSLAKPIITSDWSVLRDYFNKGTVHVDNTPDRIAAAVTEVRTDPERFAREIVALRGEVRQEWEESRRLLIERLEATPPSASTAT